VLEVLDKFRDVDDDDLQIQCDVFYDEQHSDEEELAALTSSCLDLNSHLDVFNAVYDQVI